VNSTTTYRRLVRAFTCLAALLPASAIAAPVAVEIHESTEGYRLLRAGEPYFVRGAGGQGRLADLRAAGANSVRTWHTRGARRVLDEAHTNGMTVTVGLWLRHPRHGFDYTDADAVARQRESVLEAVAELRDHPALLAWGVGNEVELMSDPNLVFPELNTVAKQVKELDPNHPTMVIIAGGEREKIRAFIEHCPDVDLLGVNSYAADIASVPGTLTESGYDGPYLVTEWGPRGHWHSPRAPWGAPLEETSTEKAASFRMGYEAAIASAPDRCLGSYVFLWGQKQEKTKTWYGMILPTGETTQTLDTMTELWTGEEPAQRAPRIGSIRSSVAMGTVAPGAIFEAAVRAGDPDGDTLGYEWVIIDESQVVSAGGDPEDDLREHPALTLTAGPTATFRAPAEAGEYRLFVTVRDGTGRAATANTPFRVE
jgi:hypothetical protein